MTGPAIQAFDLEAGAGVGVTVFVWNPAPVDCARDEVEDL
jgi:hypothetical protein